MLHIDDAHQQLTKLVGDIGRHAAGAPYIFRGENQVYPIPMSSTLYRDYANENVLDDIDLVAIQSIELATARRHAPGITDDRELLQLIQHHQGKTNLVDFTRDLNVALFFACDGEPEEDGAIYFVDETQWEPAIIRPMAPANRVISQKSVFVEPPGGYVPLADYARGPFLIPARLKQDALRFLHSQHDISRATIYNDLHGFIGQRRFVRQAIIAIGEGLHLYNTGDFENAVAKFSTAIEYDPENADARLYRAQALAKAATTNLHGLSTIIGHDYDEAVRLQPESFMARLNRGYWRLGHGEIQDAITDLQEALRIQPRAAIAHNNIGLAFLESNQPAAAIWHFNQSVAIDPDEAIAHNNLGVAYHRLGQLSMAIHHYEQALRLDPELQTARDSLDHARQQS